MACTNEVVMATVGTCAAPAFATRSEQTTCPSSYSVFGVGKPVDSHYFLSGLMCTTSYDVEPGVKRYQSTGEQPISSFQHLPPAASQTFGRLTRRELIAGPGFRMHDRWYDSARKEQCIFSTAGDGQTHCMSESQAAVVVFYYSDAECTKPLAPVYNACTPTLIAQFDQSYCPTRQHLFPVTGSYTGTAYGKTASGCDVVSTGSAKLFSVGAEIPASAFVGATEMMD